MRYKSMTLFGTASIILGLISSIAIMSYRLGSSNGRENALSELEADYEELERESKRDRRVVLEEWNYQDNDDSITLPSIRVTRRSGEAPQFTCLVRK